jgi:hypothetical protein
VIQFIQCVLALLGTIASLMQMHGAIINQQQLALLCMTARNRKDHYNIDIIK